MQKYLFALLFFCTFTISSQENTVTAIQNTIQNYYDGYIFRDLDKLNKAFDLENGTMKVPILNDDITVGFKNLYFKELIPKWGTREKLAPAILKNCALQILNIDVVDAQIASAKISMKVDTVVYIDILSLQKIKDVWKITNKIYLVRE